MDDAYWLLLLIPGIILICIIAWWVLSKRRSKVTIDEVIFYGTPEEIAFQKSFVADRQKELEEEEHQPVIKNNESQWDKIQQQQYNFKNSQASKYQGNRKIE